MKSKRKTIKTLLRAGVLSLCLTAVCSAAFGGSVTVFTTDFNAGAPPEFSGVTTTEGVQGYAGLGTGLNVFGGDFLRNTSGGSPMGTPGSPTMLTLTGLPPHNSINLNFLLAIIDSWDGETCCYDPDIFNVRIDGNLIFSESFTNISSEHSASYPSPTTPAAVVLAREQQLGWGLDNFDHLDSAYNMGLEPTFQDIPHTSSTLTIEWFASGGGWQGGSDESWAIDNVEVTLNDGMAVFSSFSIKEAHIRFNRTDDKDSFDIQGRFVPGAASNGINILGEAVTIAVGEFSATLPAGSFVQHGNKFTFVGNADGVLAQIWKRGSVYDFRVHAGHVDLGGKITNLTTIRLVVGDDRGEVKVRMMGELNLVQGLQ